MRVLVMTDDTVGESMAGSAVRAWELAQVLDKGGHEVRLVAAAGSTAPNIQRRLLADRPSWRWAQAVISPVWSLPPRGFVGRHLLIADGITPLLAELEQHPDTLEIVRRRRTAAARIPLVAARADAILTAGPAQVQWWAQRVRNRFGVPFLTVPFGIPDDPPPDDRDQILGVPDDWAVVLWWGGVWPWLDLDTLLAARARLGSVPVSVVVPTGPRPGSAVAQFTAADLDEAARRHRLTPPQVVALDRWVPYGERHRILNRASLVAVLHGSTDEASLSFRTRALDGLWAGVPLLLTEGGEVARLARDGGWGGVVPAGDVKATAATMELMLNERTQMRTRAILAETRGSWRWSVVAQPLLKTLPDLPAVRRSSLVGAALDAIRALLIGPPSGVWR